MHARTGTVDETKSEDEDESEEKEKKTSPTDLLNFFCFIRDTLRFQEDVSDNLFQLNSIENYHENHVIFSATKQTKITDFINIVPLVPTLINSKSVYKYLYADQHHTLLFFFVACFYLTTSYLLMYFCNIASEP